MLSSSPAVAGPSPTRYSAAMRFLGGLLSGRGRLVRWAVVLLLWIGTAVAVYPLPAHWMGPDLPRTLFLIVKAVALVLLPGTSLVLAVWPREGLDAAWAMGMGVAASLAIFPLMLLWGNTLGLAITPNVLRGVLIAGALFLTYRVMAPTSTRASLSPADVGVLLALGGIFALSLGGRLYAIWGIVYPPGADTYHHTIITDLILRSGAIPAGYRPYAPIDGYSYHFGYHTYSAFLAMLTDLPPHRAVFWGAQFLNALTVPSLYVLVTGATRDRVAGLCAAIVGGLTCHMPATYMIWGRSPQLAGQVILPVLMALTVVPTAAPRPRWRRAALAGILLGGLVLTHYRVTILYGAFAVVVGCQAIFRRRLAWRWLARVGGGLGAIAVLACLLTLPWALAFLRGTAPMSQEAVSLNQTRQLDALTLKEVVTWGLRPSLLTVTAIASLWSLRHWRRRRLSVMMIAWTALLLILATPQLSGIPPGFVTYRTVIIALYLPAAVILGVALSALPDLEVRAVTREAGRETRGRPVNVRLRVIVGVVFVLFGAREMMGVRSTPRHELVRNVDREAMEWIRRNTPLDAVFAVEPLFYLPWAAAGNDAGYWLPYSAGRATILPPMIYTAEGTPSFVDETNATLRGLTEARSPEELAEYLRAQGAQYVYITGPTENSWKEHALDDRLFETVYRSGDIRVVRLR